jgi:hypothetical protein
MQRFSHRSIIVVNDPYPFLVFDTAIPLFFMCSAQMGGTLLLLRWRRLDCRASSVRNGVRMRDYTGEWHDCIQFWKQLGGICH